MLWLLFKDNRVAQLADANQQDCLSIRESRFKSLYWQVSMPLNSPATMLMLCNTAWPLTSQWRKEREQIALQGSITITLFYSVTLCKSPTDKSSRPILAWKVRMPHISWQGIMTTYKNKTLRRRHLVRWHQIWMEVNVWEVMSNLCLWQYYCSSGFVIKPSVVCVHILQCQA